MVEKVIEFSIKNKLIIALFVLGILGAGLYSVYTIKLGSLPDITNNQVQVITVAPNLSTVDIERFVTYPVELAMGYLPGVKEIRSISRFGLSVVTVVFEDDMGTYLPRQLIQEKLVEVREEIPQQFGTPTMGPITTGLGEIYQYSLVVEPPYDTVYSLTELRTIQDWIIKRQLTMIEGVIEVNSFGGAIKQYEIAINPDKLNSLGISLTDVLTALTENNINAGAAYIEKNKIANFIRIEGLIRSIKDIENITIRTKEGFLITLKDLADKIGFGEKIRYGAFTQDGREGVGGMVLMLKDANSNEVIQKVRKRIEKIQKTLPPGIKIVPYHDRSELIKMTTSTITKNLVEGALIVIFVLVILLGSLRGGLITASVIPLSLLFAFIMMRFTDVWANLMSLGAIDFGIIVDGAVIIVEGTVHFLEQKVKKYIKQEEMDEITHRAASSVMNSAFFGQLIILIVFAPILFLTGIEGKMFHPMAYTFGYAVFGAIILCLTYVPMVSALALKPIYKNNWLTKTEKFIENFSHKIMHIIEKAYFPVLNKALNYKVTTLIIAILLFSLSLYIFTHMGGEFIPKLDEGDLAIQVQIRPGSSLTEMIETTKKVEKILKENFPEVETSIARIGVADIPTDPMPMDVADMVVVLQKDKKKWRSAKSKEELIKKIKNKLEEELVGVNLVFSQPIELRFNELLTGVREDVVIKIFGEDLNILYQKAQEIAKLISNVPGIRDISPERASGMPQITISFNREKLARYGVSIQQVADYISTGYVGKAVGTIYEGEKRFDLVLRFSEDIRQDLDKLHSLLVELPDGSKIPLDEIAEVKFISGPMQISRENTFRRTYVGINLQGRDVESVIKDVQKILDTQLKLPEGYYITYGGSFENLERAKKRLGVVIPIALFLILLLIYFALKSVKQTFMIFLAVPLATIGGILFLYLRGMPFSISAGVGFIVLFGVAILNGLVLINRLNSLKAEGITDIYERIQIATKERLRPILLTATSAIMGFTPMAFSTSAGAEVQRPLATVVIGGLISATFLTLVIIPVLYSIIEKQKSKIKMSATITILLLLLAPNMYAQNNITSVEQAINIAMKNNTQIQIANNKIILHQKNIKSSVLLPKTDFSFQYGQYNSFYNDFGISIDQSFQFPTYYKNVKKFSEIKVLQAEQEKYLIQAQTELLIKNAWCELAYKNDLLKFYKSQDTLYTKFLKAATLRYQTGEANYLEKLTAETKLQEIENKIKQIEIEINKITNLLQMLLNDTTNKYNFIPPENYKRNLLLDIEENVSEHPITRVAEAKILASKYQTNIIKSELLPEFSVGYFNISMIGNETRSGQLATFSDRFQGIQGTISLPLFVKPYKNQIKVSKLNTQILQLEKYNTELKLKTQLQQQINELQKQLNNLNYYENYALKQAEEIINNAYKSYIAGEINYIEYFNLITQAFDIKIMYYNSLYNYNLTVNLLEFLTNK